MGKLVIGVAVWEFVMGNCDGEIAVEEISVGKLCWGNCVVEIAVGGNCVGEIVMGKL